MDNALNKTQSRVLGLYAYGSSASEIADVIGLSEVTVLQILSSAKDILRANSLTHAAVIFVTRNYSAQDPVSSLQYF